MGPIELSHGGCRATKCPECNKPSKRLTCNSFDGFWEVLNPHFCQKFVGIPNFKTQNSNSKKSQIPKPISVNYYNSTIPEFKTQNSNSKETNTKKLITVN